MVLSQSKANRGLCGYGMNNKNVIRYALLGKLTLTGWDWSLASFLRCASVGYIRESFEYLIEHNRPTLLR